MRATEDPRENEKNDEESQAIADQAKGTYTKHSILVRATEYPRENEKNDEESR